MSIFKKIFFISFTVCLMVFVIFIKSEVRSLSTQTRQIMKQQEKLEENIQVLEAEFAYLTNPKRLERLSQNLNLKTIDFYSTKPQLVSLRYKK